ncbi:class I SAM-dependent methyltransferase [Streptomyces sp. NPDC005438]|uniref:class I SAM-dependent methyltransferase n=1 Tax=Streptomyces sp. NPDC005438 TaxID=3156880 RepID=UPI0033A56C73
MNGDFDKLVAEAAEVPVDGWDFSWLDGRATEERPSWGYSRLLARRLERARVAVDLQTGGGEVLNSAPRMAPTTVATESWPDNLARARALLGPRGVTVVAESGRPPLPFATGSFDLAVSRHPVDTHWRELSRILRPGGLYLSQQVGPASVFELAEFFLGPLPASSYRARHPEDARTAAREVGLEVLDLRCERLRMEFGDIGAVVYFLRKVVWIVPGFDVRTHRERLLRLHRLIEERGPFVAHSSRFLIEARKTG